MIRDLATAAAAAGDTRIAERMEKRAAAAERHPGGRPPKIVAKPALRCDPDEELECPNCHSLSIGDAKIHRPNMLVDKFSVGCGGCGHRVTAPTRRALIKKLRRAV